MTAQGLGPCPPGGRLRLISSQLLPAVWISPAAVHTQGAEPTDRGSLFPSLSQINLKKLKFH